MMEHLYDINHSFVYICEIKILFYKCFDPLDFSLVQSEII